MNIKNPLSTLKSIFLEMVNLSKTNKKRFALLMGVLCYDILIFTLLCALQIKFGIALMLIGVIVILTFPEVRSLYVSGY